MRLPLDNAPRFITKKRQKDDKFLNDEWFIGIAYEGVLTHLSLYQRGDNSVEVANSVASVVLNGHGQLEILVELLPSVFVDVIAAPLTFMLDVFNHAFHKHNPNLFELECCDDLKKYADFRKEADQHDKDDNERRKLYADTYSAVLSWCEEYVTELEEEEDNTVDSSEDGSDETEVIATTVPVASRERGKGKAVAEASSSQPKRKASSQPASNRSKRQRIAETTGSNRNRSARALEARDDMEISTDANTVPARASARTNATHGSQRKPDGRLAITSVRVHDEEEDEERLPVKKRGKKNKAEGSSEKRILEFEMQPSTGPRGPVNKPLLERQKDLQDWLGKYKDVFIFGTKETGKLPLPQIKPGHAGITVRKQSRNHVLELKSHIMDVC